MRVVKFQIVDKTNGQIHPHIHSLLISLEYELKNEKVYVFYNAATAGIKIGKSIIQPRKIYYYKNSDRYSLSYGFPRGKGKGWSEKSFLLPINIIEI